MRVRVDTHLRLDHNALRGSEIASITARLSVKNPDRERMRQEMVRGWERVPERIDIWEERSGELILPRGFARELASMHPDIDWDDRRREVPIDTCRWLIPNAKGPHQERAMSTIFSVQQGVIQMPPGSGKTVAVLEGIRRAGQRAIVIVDKTNIAAQWADRCRHFLGFEPGIVGDGEWNEHEWITIALQQTLWSRREQLHQSGFFERFGFVCLDECHHAAAGTFYDMLQRFPAKWRIGVSATPYKTPGLEPYIDAVLGGTALEAPSDDRVDPEVRVVKTDFHALFWPTHRRRDGGGCGFKYCTRNGTIHRNNYSDIMGTLVDDPDRNMKIVTRIATSYRMGRSVLVISKRIKHLSNVADLLAMTLGSSDDIYMLTGAQDTSERMQIARRAAHGKCVILSTIADEALDIPRLDSLHLIWPTKNTELLKQQVGRVLRPHPAKLKPELVDYEDDVGVLRRQLDGRVGMYRSEGWPVVY